MPSEGSKGPENHGLECGLTLGEKEICSSQLSHMACLVSPGRKWQRHQYSDDTHVNIGPIS